MSDGQCGNDTEQSECTNMNCHGQAEYAYWMPDLGQFSRVRNPDHDMVDDCDLAPFVCESCRDYMAGGPHWDGERFVDPREKIVADGGVDLAGDCENIGGKEPNGKPAAIGRWTFQTKKVRDALLPYLQGRVLNAFAGKTRLDDYRRGITEVRNDLNPERDADYHIDAADLGDKLEPESFDMAVLDPPFSQSQADEHYDGLHARDMGEVRREVASLVKPGGTIVEFGFNLYDASDYLTLWHREDKRLFRRAIPERPPVFMTVCERSQQTLGDTESCTLQPDTEQGDTDE